MNLEMIALVAFFILLAIAMVVVGACAWRQSSASMNAMASRRDRYASEDNDDLATGRAFRNAFMVNADV